jgi:hypothetical protein
MAVILENALGLRLITLIMGIPALYLLDHHVAHAAIDWTVLIVVGVTGTHMYVRLRITPSLTLLIALLQWLVQNRTTPILLAQPVSEIQTTNNPALP